MAGDLLVLALFFLLLEPLLVLAHELGHAVPSGLHWTCCSVVPTR